MTLTCHTNWQMVQMLFAPDVSVLPTTLLNISVVDGWIPGVEPRGLWWRQTSFSTHGERVGAWHPHQRVVSLLTLVWFRLLAFVLHTHTASSYRFCSNLQCGRGQVSGHTVRLRDSQRAGAQLQAHPGGDSVHSQHLQLPVWRPEMQPDLPELAPHQYGIFTHDTRTQPVSVSYDHLRRNGYLISLCRPFWELLGYICELYNEFWRPSWTQTPPAGWPTSLEEEEEWNGFPTCPL